jgi:hypothetical protein
VTRVLFIDPFGGASGDLLFGALLDLGADPDQVRDTLAGLRLDGWRLEVRRDRQQGFAGTRVNVVVDTSAKPARRLADVEELLSGASLPDPVRAHSLAAFRRLFEVEAAAHGVSVERAHLHELAAVDAVIDIVGVCAAVWALGVDRVECGPVPVGSGTVQTEHGLLPVPPPAVALLLQGVPMASHAAEAEMTTPTGAVLLTTLADRFGRLPGGVLRGVGVGLGRRQHVGMPNLLRAMMIETDPPDLAPRSWTVVETTVDDVTGEAVASLITRLMVAGAVDAWCLQGVGKKGRPVIEVRALCDVAHCPAVTAVFFTDGATLGVRVLACERPELERRVVTVTTAFGPIPVKLGLYAGRIVSAKPEHDACEAAADHHATSLQCVVDAARRAAPAPGTAVGND